MIRLIVRSAAEADIADAQAWYAERDDTLADRFIDELRTTLRRVRDAISVKGGSGTLRGAPVPT